MRQVSIAFRLTHPSGLTDTQTFRNAVEMGLNRLSAYSSFRTDSNKVKMSHFVRGLNRLSAYSSFRTLFRRRKNTHYWRGSQSPFGLLILQDNDLMHALNFRTEERLNRLSAYSSFRTFRREKIWQEQQRSLNRLSAYSSFRTACSFCRCPSRGKWGGSEGDCSESHSSYS